MDAEHGIPCYLLWRSICLLVTIFLHPTRNCIQWSNSDVLVVTNWLLPTIIRVGDTFYFYDLATKICKNSGAKADHKLSLLLVPSFLRGVRLTLDVDASVEEGVKTTCRDGSVFFSIKKGVWLLLFTPIGVAFNCSMADYKRGSQT